MYETYIENTPQNFQALVSSRKGRLWKVENISDEGDWKCYVNKTAETSTRKALFIGTGRCGTQFISAYCQKNGVGIGHEIVGVHGTSSHWFAFDADWYPVLMTRPFGTAHVGERRSDFVFENVFHVVRHPLHTIQSMYDNFHDADYAFLLDNGLPLTKAQAQDKLLASMAVYHYVNEVCETQTDSVIHAETVYEVLPDIVQALFNIDKDRQLSVPIQNAGTHKTTLMWKDVLNKDEGLFKKLFEMGIRYGYVMKG